MMVMPRRSVSMPPETWLHKVTCEAPVEGAGVSTADDKTIVYVESPIFQQIFPYVAVALVSAVEVGFVYTAVVTLTAAEVQQDRSVERDRHKIESSFEVSSLPGLLLRSLSTPLGLRRQRRVAKIGNNRVGHTKQPRLLWR